MLQAVALPLVPDQGRIAVWNQKTSCNNLPGRELDALAALPKEQRFNHPDYHGLCKKCREYVDSQA